MCTLWMSSLYRIYNVIICKHVTLIIIYVDGLAGAQLNIRTKVNVHIMDIY